MRINLNEFQLANGSCKGTDILRRAVEETGATEYENKLL
jgi:hypothetical protein